jgi:hypothetical protein
MKSQLTFAILFCIPTTLFGADKKLSDAELYLRTAIALRAPLELPLKRKIAVLEKAANDYAFRRRNKLGDYHHVLSQIKRLNGELHALQSSLPVPEINEFKVDAIGTLKTPLGVQPLRISRNYMVAGILKERESSGLSGSGSVAGFSRALQNSLLSAPSKPVIGMAVYVSGIDTSKFVTAKTIKGIPGVFRVTTKSSRNGTFFNIRLVDQTVLDSEVSKWIKDHSPKPDPALRKLRIVQETREKERLLKERSHRSASKLILAKRYLKMNKRELAKKRLAEIVKRYGDTPAAAEAGKLLKGL